MQCAERDGDAVGLHDVLIVVVAHGTLRARVRGEAPLDAPYTSILHVQLTALQASSPCLDVPHVFFAHSSCGFCAEFLVALPTLLMIVGICLTVTFLTEITSNTATTALLLPVLAAVAISTGADPLLLMIPATLAASCAFMLPVATAPNAIIVGTGSVDPEDMMRTGMLLNLVGVVPITVAVLIFL